MNIKRILLWGVLPLALLFFITWGYCQWAGADNYNYQGYVTAIRKAEDGTVITILNGEDTAEFTLKWYTRKTFSGELKELKEGAFIKIITTKSSDTTVRKFSAFEAFSTEGKIVFLEGHDTPFILTLEKTFKYYKLYSLISAQDIDYPLETGTQVKIYYQYPLNQSTTTVVVDVIQPTSDILSPLTQEELTFIQRMNYTVASK